VIGVPTSEATRADAERCGVPLTTLDAIDRLDLTVDGADEVDPNLDLIKGGGGALPREVVPFGLAATRRAIGQAFAQCGLTGTMAIRSGTDGHAFVTDGGHWI